MPFVAPKIGDRVYYGLIRDTEVVARAATIVFVHADQTVELHVHVAIDDGNYLPPAEAPENQPQTLVATPLPRTLVIRERIEQSEIEQGDRYWYPA